MKKSAYFLSTVFLLLSTSVSLSPLKAESMTLDQVLEKVQKVGASLKGMRAQIVQKKWTDILEEYDQGEVGELYFMKEKGLYLRKEIRSPASNTLLIKEGEVLFYQPAIKQAQKYQLGRHGDKAEFFLLGFGSDRAELEKAYEIKLIDSAEMDGRQTYQLELTPRANDVAAFFVKILLWIDAKTWVPVQQKLIEPTQDHLLISFDKVELNPKLSKSDFQLKLPKDVSVISN